MQKEIEAPPKPRLFASLTDDALLSYGVPAEWLNDVRKATEDTVLALADHLPAEAAEALLENLAADHDIDLRDCESQFHGVKNNVGGCLPHGFKSAECVAKKRWFEFGG